MYSGKKKLGEGGFNTAYLSDENDFVFKINFNPSATDTPERSVRLWDAINPGYPAKVMKVKELGKGWQCPYIHGRQSTDEEMSQALVDIFNKTGRIIVDAVAKKNFITTEKGQVICIDIGLALQMENREKAQFSTAIRRHSVVSLDTWKEFNYDYNTNFFENDSSRANPNTTSTIKALLFIKANRPDMFGVNFLKNDKDGIIQSLAQAYDHSMPYHAFRSQAVVQHGLNILLEKRPLYLENLQKSCVHELQKYINSRGNIKNEKYTRSLGTIFFRKTDVSTYKIKQAQSAIEKIQNADSIDEIGTLITACLNNKTLMKSGKFFSSDFASRISMCQLMVETAQKNKPDTDPTLLSNKKLSSIPKV